MESPDRSSKTHLLASNCPQIVMTAIMIGTPMKAPGIPHRNNQKKTENNTTNGDIDSAAPATRGSQIAADQELNEIEADKDHERHLPRFGLRDREHAGKDRGDKRSYERNIVQGKGDDPPRGGELDPGEQGKCPNCNTRHDAHARADDHVPSKFSGN